MKYINLNRLIKTWRSNPTQSEYLYYYLDLRTWDATITIHNSLETQLFENYDNEKIDIPKT